MARLEVRKTSDKGNGVFAIEPVLRGSFLVEFRGAFVEAKDIPFPLPPEDDQFLQVGPGLFLGPTDAIDNMVNHSCEPNAAVGFNYYRAYLFALRDIAEGEEVTFDYSTTSTDPPSVWALTCRCGTPSCRGTVSGFQTLPPAVQAKYLDLRVVPPYVFDRALRDWIG